MPVTNQDISRKLREQARALAHSGDNLYRIRAYRRAAMAVLTLPVELSSIVESRGREGLAEVPGIGRKLADTITELLKMNAGSGPLAV